MNRAQRHFTCLSWTVRAIIATIVFLPWNTRAACDGQTLEDELPAFVTDPSMLVDLVPNTMSAGMLRLENRLRQTTLTTTGEMTLEAVVDWLGQLGIPARFDIRALEDISIDPKSETVQPQQYAASLGKHLLGMFDSLGLTYFLTDELVVLTSTEEAANELLTISYDVTALVPTHAQERDVLVDAITATVEPDTWEEVGGPGSLRMLSRGGQTLMVVSNTYHTQVALRRMLNDLARLSKSGRSARMTALALPTSGSIDIPLASSTSWQGSTSVGSSAIQAPAPPEKRGINFRKNGSMGGMGGMFSVGGSNAHR